MQTRSITPERSSRAVTCQSTRTRRRAISVHEPPKLGVGDEATLSRAGALHRLEQRGVALLRNVEPELLDLDPNRVEAALLAQDDPAGRADEVGRVRLDGRWIVKLSRHGARLAGEEVVAGDRLPGGKR